MKFLAAVIILILINLKVSGQGHFIGIIGGASSSNVSSKSFPSNNDSRQAFTGGLTYSYVFKNHVTTEVDLIFSQRGFSNHAIFTDNTGEPTGGKAAYKYNYNYLSLPIKTGYTIGSKLYGFGNVGVIPSLLIKAETILPVFGGEGTITGSETVEITDHVKKIDIAGQVQIGAGYMFYKNLGLFSTLGYQRSLTTFTSSDYFPESRIRHKGGSLCMGVKYRL
jgi:hypothetical protein